MARNSWNDCRFHNRNRSHDAQQLRIDVDFQFRSIDSSSLHWWRSSRYSEIASHRQSQSFGRESLRTTRQSTSIAIAHRDDDEIKLFKELNQKLHKMNTARCKQQVLQTLKIYLLKIIIYLLKYTRINIVCSREVFVSRRLKSSQRLVFAGRLFA